MTLLELAEAVVRVDGLEVEIVFEACPSTTRRCASPTSRAPARCSAGSPRSSSTRACERLLASNGSRGRLQAASRSSRYPLALRSHGDAPCPRSEQGRTLQVKEVLSERVSLALVALRHPARVLAGNGRVAYGGGLEPRTPGRIGLVVQLSTTGPFLRQRSSGGFLGPGSSSTSVVGTVFDTPATRS
jgi:hypothetical protein